MSDWNIMRHSFIRYDCLDGYILQHKMYGTETRFTMYSDGTIWRVQVFCSTKKQN